MLFLPDDDDENCIQIPKCVSLYDVKMVLSLMKKGKKIKMKKKIKQIIEIFIQGNGKKSLDFNNVKKNNKKCKIKIISRNKKRTKIIESIFIIRDYYYSDFEENYGETKFDYVFDEKNKKFKSKKKFLNEIENKKFKYTQKNGIIHGTENNLEILLSEKKSYCSE